MLRLDLGGQPYSKAEHNRTLRESLDARTKGSVEFKHQNVSAVLLGMGLPYIDGYKPARNYQRSVLPQAIQNYLDAHPEVHEQLSRLGEQFAVEVERRRLLSVGRDDLASRVEWVAETCGDGVGFDVLSFDGADDSECWIEVKTTGLGKYFPFVVTANEVRCSEDLPERFHLYRVFDFARRPRVYVLKGALSASCRLQPNEYRASIGG